MRVDDTVCYGVVICKYWRWACTARHRTQSGCCRASQLRRVDAVRLRLSQDECLVPRRRCDGVVCFRRRGDGRHQLGYPFRYPRHAIAGIGARNLVALRTQVVTTDSVHVDRYCFRETVTAAADRHPRTAPPSLALKCRRRSAAAAAAKFEGRAPAIVFHDDAHFRAGRRHSPGHPMRWAVQGVEQSGVRVEFGNDLKRRHRRTSD